MAQRLSLAAALLGGPRAPLLDEPANGAVTVGLVAAAAAGVSALTAAPGRR
jgi:hypothetical protein